MDSIIHLLSVPVAAAPCGFCVVTNNWLTVTFRNLLVLFMYSSNVLVGQIFGYVFWSTENTLTGCIKPLFCCLDGYSLKSSTNEPSLRELTYL